MKKYCENCKYWKYHGGFVWNGNFYCNASKKYGKIIEGYDSPLKKRKPFREVWGWEEAMALNRNNDCPYYKRKWYKLFN